MRRLVFGGGYLGLRVAARWRDDGDDVFIITRSETRAESLQSNGFLPVVANVIDQASITAGLEALQGDFDSVLYSVGYDRSSGEDRRAVAIDGPVMAATLLSGQVGHWVFTSSTSVYGQADGSWVDEDSSTEPLTENGQRCVDAERAITDAVDTSLTILRLAGLYGPGRVLAKAETLQSQTPMPGNGDQWLNLIHIDDAAAACLAATEQRHHGLVLTSDDEPVRRADYYAALAALLKAPPPLFDGQARTTRGASNKRCRNVRLKQELLSELSFPTYREGLTEAMSR